MSSSKVIRVDQDVYEHIKKDAEPLVDTPSTVLRRQLGTKTVASDVTPPKKHWTQTARGRRIMAENARKMNKKRK